MAQLVHVLLAASAKVPGAHCVQVLLCGVATLPEAQAVQFWADCPLNVLARQGEQAVVPEDDAKKPAAQAVHDEELSVLE